MAEITASAIIHGMSALRRARPEPRTSRSKSAIKATTPANVSPVVVSNVDVAVLIRASIFLSSYWLLISDLCRELSFGVVA